MGKFKDEVNKLLNKKYKDCIVTKIPDTKFIQTSVPTLNYMISGRPLTGGFPLSGKMSVIYGPEGGGKTSLTGFLLAEAQKKGLMTIFIDTERALTSTRIKEFDVNEEELFHLQPDYMEQAFEMIEQICIQKISLGENELDILCVYDSIASTPTKDEKERAMDDKEMASQAKIITRSLRKIRGSVQKANMGVIFINQSRINMDMSGRPTHGDKYTMPGGQACKHFCDVLIRMAKSKQDPNGQFIKMSVPSKNRLFKPKQAIEIYFNYVKGFLPEDNYASFVDFLIEINYMGQSGAWSYWMNDLKSIAAERNLEPKDCVKEVNKFYKKDVVHDMLTDPIKYNSILQEVEEYIESNKYEVTSLTTKDVEDPEDTAEYAPLEKSSISDEHEEEE